MDDDITIAEARQQLIELRRELLCIEEPENLCPIASAEFLTALAHMEIAVLALGKVNLWQVEKLSRESKP